MARTVLDSSLFLFGPVGSIETIDHVRGLKYTQEFKNNLDEICPPTITKCKGKPYTKVTFHPDYKRMGIDGLSPFMKQLFIKRIYDIAAVTDKKVKLKYNSNIIPVKDFQQYVSMYIGSKTEKPRVYEQMGDRWEYSVCLSPLEEFTQVSFVNGVYTSKGGKHVEYVLNQIVRKLVATIKKKKKIDVKSTAIKEQIMLFVNCSIENPSFDSQTKDFMNTPIGKFGSTCSVSDRFVDKIAKMGVMETAISLTEVKKTSEAKKSDGSKTKTIRGIPKLIDANFAGTKFSNKCTLIFVEIQLRLVLFLDCLRRTAIFLVFILLEVSLLTYVVKSPPKSQKIMKSLKSRKFSVLKF